MIRILSRIGLTVSIALFLISLFSFYRIDFFYRDGGGAIGDVSGYTISRGSLVVWNNVKGGDSMAHYGRMLSRGLNLNPKYNYSHYDTDWHYNVFYYNEYDNPVLWPTYVNDMG